MNSKTIPEIYVLWHPRFANGEALALRIHRWLRPGGLGPQVFYRSLPAPEAPAGGLPPALPNELRLGVPPPGIARYPESSLDKLQVVLLLIDAQMIADPAWRYWINALGESAGSQRVLLPIALDGTAYNVPPALQQLNFLRPTGVPAGAADSLWSAEVLESVARSLQKQLTEALCDLMLSPDPCPGAESPFETSRSKVKIFLSHAKADGSEPARRIRDYIYSQTQIAAFFDENDIPFGSLFGRVLDRNVGGPGMAAAMIAVRSARYASRPWCRREVSLFRQPILENERDPVDGAQWWTLNPLLVVDAVEGGKLSLGIPELGNSPSVRWSESVPRQEEEIVTTVLRDVLLAAYHRAVGRQMPDERDCVVINWLPDPASLLHIRQIRLGAKLRVFYPGRGLSGPELQTLEEFFPMLRFISFDRVIT